MKINEIEATLQPGQKEIVSDQDEHKYIELIQTNCSDAVRAIQDSGFLYRGVGDNSAPDIFKGRSREDRQSLSGADAQQEMFDKIITNYGFKANRSNSIFCSGDKYQSRSYGELYLIFPINGYNLLWSEKIRDFVHHSDDFYGDAKRALHSNNPKDAMDQLIKYYKIRDDSLAPAILSHKEILINGSYYAFSYKKYAMFFKTYL
jgi:hypothetical protein